MNRDPQIVTRLNAVLKNELTAINQYFLHAKILQDWGFEQLGGKERAASIDEMKHAEALADRILFLEGLPNFQDLGKLHIGENVPEILRADLDLERTAHPVLTEAIAETEAKGDYVSRELLAGILASEEEHIHWLEVQLELIDRMGLENYLQSSA